MRRFAAKLLSPRFSSARFIVIAFVCTRAAVLLLDFTAMRVIGVADDAPNAAKSAVEPPDTLVGTLVRFHGHAYARVARVGYEPAERPSSAAAPAPQSRASSPSAIISATDGLVPFPVLPYLSRWLAAATSLSAPVAGVVLSHAALLGALFFVFGIARRYLDLEGARRAVLLVLVFPTSLFFSVYSPEALFFFFSAGSLWAYERARLALSGGLGALAALTLPVGVLLFPALVAGALWRGRGSPPGRAWSPRILWLLAIPGALCAFAVWFHAMTGDALAFVMASGPDTTPFPLLTVLRETARVEWSFPVADTEQVALAFGLVAALGLFAAAAHALRRLDAAHALFLLFVLAGTLSSGHTTTLCRTAAAMVPLYLVLAMVTAKAPAERFVLFASTLFLGVHTLVWATGNFAG